jgi:hypothetical protein
MRKYLASNPEVTKESKVAEVQKSDRKKYPEKTKEPKEPESCGKRTCQVADAMLVWIPYFCLPTPFRMFSAAMIILFAPIYPFTAFLPKDC